MGKLDTPEMKRAIAMAKEVKRQLESEPKKIEYPGFRRTATRASQYIANQPEETAQAIISRYLGIPK